MSNATSSSSVTGAEGIDMAALLSEYDSSGRSAAAFARERGLAPWKVYYALRRRSGARRVLRRSSRESKSPLVPVRVVDGQTTARAAPLELALAGGHRVLVPADFDETALRRLLGVLAGC